MVVSVQSEKKKSGCLMKILAGIGAVVVLSVILAMCSSGSEDSSSNSATSSTSSSVATQESTDDSANEGETGDTENGGAAEAPSSTEERDENMFEYSDMTVSYGTHEVTTDELGQTVLIVYYSFTNNTDENKTFDYTFEVTAFQNGVALESSWWNDNTELKNSDNEIAPGAAATVATAFVLGESRENVTLQITPFWGDDVLLQKELALQ